MIQKDKVLFMTEKDLDKIINGHFVSMLDSSKELYYSGIENLSGKPIKDRLKALNIETVMIVLD